jgi:putative ATP-dependent endonuclease of OLD family
MIADSIYFLGHHCFKTEWAGFDSIQPINVIIGRNNTGKSHLLDLAQAICDGNLNGRKWRYRCSGILDETALRDGFNENINGGELAHNHWRDHGVKFLNVPVAWETDQNFNPENITFPSGHVLTSPYGERSTNARMAQIPKILQNVRHKLSGTVFRRILADRDIKPEFPSVELGLSPDGSGASNIIRRYIVTSNSRYPREIIQKNLLNALNVIFIPDGHFTEIQVKEHDEEISKNQKGHWEIYLGEEKKGLIPLGSSGSGLKTVFLVLLNLLVIPEIQGKKKSEFTYAFEELENNLHPALLRRLFQYLESYAIKEKSHIFLTTHSSTALDIFGLSKNAQIIHVAHDGEAARTTTISAHFDHLGVISELGAKPSDLLQANGIIWVEGPSDCIYLNRWIDLYTKGRLQEGRDYQCAFYGGSLLARTQFKSPEDAEEELVNLFRVNPNIIVICDGDRTAKGARVKNRVRRISAEVRKIPRAHIWVTEAREIENYVPGAVLATSASLAALPDPTQYEIFFPRKGSRGHSYVETRMNRKGMDKMDLAILSAPQMDRSMMVTRFEWEAQMRQIVERIDSWNR